MLDVDEWTFVHAALDQGFFFHMYATGQDHTDGALVSATPTPCTFHLYLPL